MLLRIEALRRRLDQLHVPAMLVTNPVNVAYLTGFTGTLGYLLVSAKNTYLLTDFRYLEQAGIQAKHCEIVDVCSSAWKRTADLLQGEGINALAVEGDHVIVETFEKMKVAMAGISLDFRASPVNVLRNVKSASEVAAIAAAVGLADQAFAHILSFIKPGVRERELALELEFFMRKQGASGLSFDMIVASGYRSALPHGVASDKRLELGDAVVMDFGCILAGYCSDLSRTVFVGQASGKQKKVYEAVLSAQCSALSNICAGMTGREADAFAREVLAGYGYGEHFGHGLGHGLGREIHEGPRLSPAGEEVLAAGMVVTVEPGVYINGEFGIRIEDVVVIEEDGVRNLTSCSKELFSL